MVRKSEDRTSFNSDAFRIAGLAHGAVSLDVVWDPIFCSVGRFGDQKATTEVRLKAAPPLYARAATVVVDFTGYEIRNSGFDGPYLVNLLLYDDAFNAYDFDQQ